MRNVWTIILAGSLSLVGFDKGKSEDDGGGALGQDVGGPGYKFEDELSPEMDMGPGTLAMANAGPVTNGSQFFIMDNVQRPDLAQKHSIFGMCKELDVVAKITGTPRGPRDKPATPVTMKVIITKG